MSTQWFIGTSGWSYKNWDKKFYPPDLKAENKIAHYSKHFNATEVNASFYQNLDPETYQNWRQLVPADFSFTVKLNRYMTQMKKLKVDDQTKERLDQFFEGVKNLGDKLGCILIQLPPSLKKDPEKLGNFMEVLPGEYQYALEFRNNSWFDKETENLLKSFNAAFVISDSPKWPCHITTTADFIYVRFHGKEKLFISQYKEEDLESWAKTLYQFKESNKTGYCFFNNTDHGYAIGNAKKIRELLEKG